jgi:hypothetical protein
VRWEEVRCAWCKGGGSAESTVTAQIFHGLDQAARLWRRWFVCSNECAYHLAGLVDSDPMEANRRGDVVHIEGPRRSIQAVMMIVTDGGGR